VLDLYKFVKHRILDQLPSSLLKEIKKHKVFENLQWIEENCRDESDQDCTYMNDGSGSDPEGSQSDSN
jgi:hypothetical protein